MTGSRNIVRFKKAAYVDIQQHSASFHYMTLLGAKMKKAVLFSITLLLVFSVGSIAQTNGAPDANATKYTASAIWPLTQDFLKSAHAACDSDASKTADCFIEQMTKAGAPPDAVRFTRALYSSTKQFGVMGAIKDYPPVAIAWVVFPLRANHNDALLFVNGTPPFVDLDNMQEFDKTALQKDPLFLQWKANAPQLDVYPAERSAGAPLVQYARVWPGPKPGDLQFVYSYPLLNGCATCEQSGFANYLWNFDSSGKFLGTKLLSVTRGAPPINRRSYMPAPPSQPATPAK